MVSPDQVKAMIEAQLPDAQVTVEDLTGTEITIRSSSFRPTLKDYPECGNISWCMVLYKRLCPQKRSMR